MVQVEIVQSILLHHHQLFVEHQQGILILKYQFVIIFFHY